MNQTLLFTDIGEIMTLSGAVAKQARGPIKAEDLSLQSRVAMVVENGKVAWVGAKAKLPRDIKKIDQEISLGGANVFPGFVDCHTHSIFLGERSHEFEMRNQGMSYQQIAAQGGGILSTVRETRKGLSQNLKEVLEGRLQNFLKQGVTSVEVKSGYGLSIKDELRLLKIIKNVESPVKVTSTFLGAHALPPEFRTTTDYLSELQLVLPQIVQERLAERIDIFIENNYFSLEEGRSYLSAAKNLGLDIAIHADQLSRTGASLLAVELGAVSADHAICVNDEDIQKIAKSEVTCVLLPAADFYIHCAYPPARKMIDAGVRVALSTDFNPGTAPTQNIQLVGLLSRLHMKMTLPEVFVGLTLGAAHALRKGGARGALHPGYEADFFVSTRSWNQFFYDMSGCDIQSVWINGTKKV